MMQAEIVVYLRDLLGVEWVLNPTIQMTESIKDPRPTGPLGYAFSKNVFNSRLLFVVSSSKINFESESAIDDPLSILDQRESELLRNIISATKLSEFATGVIVISEELNTFENVQSIVLNLRLPLSEKTVDPAILFVMGRPLNNAFFGVHSELFIAKGLPQIFCGHKTYPVFGLSEMNSNVELKKNVWRVLKSALDGLAN